MPGKLPPPQANVDNVLPGLLEDIRKRREAAQAADLGEAPTAGAGSPPGSAATSAQTQAQAQAQAQAPEIQELRAELRGLRRLVGVVLVLALALGVALLLGWHP